MAQTANLTATLGGFPRGDGPLYQQLALAITQAALRGDILPGTRLPPERILAHSLKLSRTTVVQAYARLREAGTALDGARLAQAGVGLHDGRAAELERVGQDPFRWKPRARQDVSAQGGLGDGQGELLIERSVAAGEAAQGRRQVGGLCHDACR